jgi:dipeptidyl aminopeptidase/acylaminoacyl peptidase
MIWTSGRTAAFLLVASVLWCAAPRAAKRYSIDDFLNSRKLQGISFAHNGKQILYSSDESGIFNAYTIASAGGPPRQLTTSEKESVRSLAYFKTDDRLLYRQDQGGNELEHIYLRRPDGSATDLTPGATGKTIFWRFRPDGKAFYFLWNQRDPKFFDVYKLHVATMEREKLYENTSTMFPVDISPDERWIAFDKPSTTNDGDVVLVDRETKQSKNITEHRGVVYNYPAAFDPKGKYLYYLTDRDHDYTYLVRYALGSGTVETVQKNNWDVVFCRFSDQGRYRVVGTNAEALTEIAVWDESTNKAVAMPRMPAGSISDVTFSSDESKMAFYLNADRSPSALYLYDLTSRKLNKLVDGSNPAIDQKDLVEAEPIRFRSFDGTSVPALLYRPHEASSSNKRPAVVEVHGGPGGQSRRTYSDLYQFLANQGFVILRVNNRGSSGYGKRFLAADDQKHGREPLRDCIEAKNYLKTLEYVDPDRIAILGGSYGGYMTLAALTFHPEEFQAGVDIFGVSNWLRTLQSMPAWWAAQREALFAEIGNPVTQEQMLREISPLFHADKIRRPLLVIQGANDPRVLKVESDEIVAAVKQNGVPVEYVVFDDEGHGFAKKANQRTAYAAIAQFLHRHLGNGPKADTARH